MSTFANDPEGYKAVIRRELKDRGVDPYLATIATKDLVTLHKRGEPRADAAEWFTGFVESGGRIAAK